MPRSSQAAVTACAASRRSALRKTIQSFLWLVVTVAIVGGYWIPLLGFTVPTVMITGIAGGFFGGGMCAGSCVRAALSSTG